MTKLLLFSVIGLPLLAQPPLPPEPTPKDVRDFILATADALTNKDVRDFLDKFDPKMPGYEELHYNLEALAARDSVLSSIEIPADKADTSGDKPHHTLQLDWTLTIDSERPNRKLVKVTIEKQGRKWKFTSLEPIDFFKPPRS